MSKLIKVGLPCPSLVAAQDLVQEHRRMGKRKPAPKLKVITLVTKRQGVVINRRDIPLAL